MNKLSIRFIALVFAAALGFCGCAAKPVPVPDTTEQPIETEPAGDPDAPTAEYDEAKHIVVITGTGNYDKLEMPVEVTKALKIVVNDDYFTMEADPSAFRYYDMDLLLDVSDVIDRTDKSFDFLREYLAYNGALDPDSGFLTLPVEYNVIYNSRIDYRVYEDKVLINNFYDKCTHREFYYLLAAMNNEKSGWEQIGYAWYVGTCVDPFSEITADQMMTSQSPYYTLCLNAGVNCNNISAEDMIKVFDAASRLCLEEGLTYWGSTYESRPVTAEPDCKRSRDDDFDGGDEKMSAFMAASFIGWLERTYGTAPVTEFCFARQTFEEAFGVDFATAFDAWETWIIETYPMD